MSTKAIHHSNAFGAAELLKSAGISAFFASVAFLITGAAGIAHLSYQNNTAPKISIATQEWKWLLNLRMNVVQPQAVASLDAVPAFEPVAFKLKPLKISRPHFARIAKSNKPVVARVAPVIAPAATPVVIVEKPFVVSQAAPASIAPVLEANAAAPETSLTVSAERLLKFQAFNLQVRRQFLMAMSIQPEVPQVSVAAAVVVEPQAKPKKTLNTQAMRQAPVARVAQPPKVKPVQAIKTETKKVIATIKVEAPKMTTHSEVSVAKVKAPVIDQIKTTQAQIETVTTQVAAPKQITEVIEAKPIPAPQSQTLPMITIEKPASVKTPQPTVAESLQKQSTEVSALFEKTNSWLNKDGYSNVTTQRTGPATSTDPIDPSVSKTGRVPSAENEYSKSLCGLTASDYHFVEAFNWDSKLFQSSMKALTKEAPLRCNANADQGAEKLSGWNVSSQKEHWPTVSWYSENIVPLISETSVKMISKLEGFEVQPATGILFGKLSAGYGIKFSGRAERPVFFSTDEKIVSEDQNSTDRYFIFMNVAPGSHLAYIVPPKGSSGGAVRIPVFGGNSTFIDLTRLTRISITGRIVDASSPNLLGLKDVTVQVANDQAEAMNVTQAGGSFAMSDILTVAHYPVFVEAEQRLGPKYRYGRHRYRVIPEDTSALTLFYVPSNQLETWLGQLDGGISTESGVIVAALPQLVSQSGSGEIYPNVFTNSQNSTLIPETYSVASSGQLQVHNPLTQDSSRFIGVQVPEGPIITQVEDKRQKILWSELTISSPGVINVIGPY